MKYSPIILSIFLGIPLVLNSLGCADSGQSRETPENKKIKEDVVLETNITDLDTFTERPNYRKGGIPEKDITTKIDNTNVRLLAHPNVHFTVTVGLGGHGHGRRPEVEVFLSKPLENEQVAEYIARRAIQKVFNLDDSEITPNMLQYSSPSYVIYAVSYK